jgi:hypothetical protein
VSTLRRVLCGLALTAIGFAPATRADEPLFGYVYTTDLLPKNKFELAQWVTWGHGNSVGQFDVS